MKLILLGFLAAIAIVAANPAAGSLKGNPTALLRGELHNPILNYRVSQMKPAFLR